MTKSVIEQVYDQLRARGAVSTRAEFCTEWLGRGEGYLRTLRFTGRKPSADAVMTCASKLGWYADRLRSSAAADHQLWLAVFDDLHGQCVSYVEAEAQRKWRGSAGL